MKTRAGYTLLELILTMTVLLIVAAISFPLAQSYLTDSRVTGAGDMVRARWAQMRAKAIEDNRPYAFKYKENTPNFRIEPYQPGVDSVNISGFVREGELPDQVLFATGNGAADGEWKLAGVIYPDGTALDDVIVSFGEKDGRHLELRLRSFTGTVTSQEIPAGGKKP